MGVGVVGAGGQPALGDEGVGEVEVCRGVVGGVLVYADGGLCVVGHIRRVERKGE